MNKPAPPPMEDQPPFVDSLVHAGEGSECALRVLVKKRMQSAAFIPASEPEEANASVKAPQ